VLNPLMDDPQFKYPSIRYRLFPPPGGGGVAYATHFILIAEGGVPRKSPNPNDLQAISAWKVQTARGDLLQSGTTLIHCGFGQFVEGALLAAVDVLERSDIRQGSRVHVVSEVGVFTAGLSQDRAKRQKRGYLQVGGRPLPGVDKWRQLDALTEQMGITMTASRPWSWEGKWEMDRLRKRASDIGAQIRKSNLEARGLATEWVSSLEGAVTEPTKK
jgi:hypothetical protein